MKRNELMELACDMLGATTDPQRLERYTRGDAARVLEDYWRETRAEEPPWTPAGCPVCAGQRVLYDVTIYELTAVNQNRLRSLEKARKLAAEHGRVVRQHWCHRCQVRRFTPPGGRWRLVATTGDGWLIELPSECAGQLLETTINVLVSGFSVLANAIWNWNELGSYEYTSEHNRPLRYMNRSRLTLRYRIGSGPPPTRWRPCGGCDGHGATRDGETCTHCKGVGAVRTHAAAVDEFAARWSDR